MPSNLPNLKPGDLVAGRFRIVEMIGSGGFSVVYRAHQEGMNRFIALKILKPTASNDEKIVERFRREALYASHLSHPNTITLFDYGHTDDGLCYIAMEYLIGMDLSAVVQRHIPMDLKRVWKILVQTCRSLAEAHRLGLVHRDLKPENIFLCQREDGEFVKVLDFGVSKAISSFGDAGPATLAPLTQEGTVFGTPLYMAPEQAMAETITPAVDVYALGHIAYEMITGHAAYEGSNNAMDVMLRQINDPPLALPAPWGDTPFSELITRCTQKDPARRISNASILLDLLFEDVFEEYMDPAERPSQVATLPRVPAISAAAADTEPFLQEDEVEEVYRWELEVLDEMLEEVRQHGQVRLAVVRGETGTGRSNLVRAFLQKVSHEPDVKVLHRAPSQEGQHEAGLEHELSRLTGSPLEGTGVQEVKRLLAELYGDDDEFSGSIEELGTDSRPLNTLSSLRDTLLSRIAEPFRRRSDDGVLVWGLENIERLDTLTLAFLDRFFRDLQAHPAPILLVLTVYPEDLKRRTGLVRYTQGLLQAGRPLARQLSLVNPGERKDDDTEAIVDGIPEDLAPDGSYVGHTTPASLPLDEPATEEFSTADEPTQRMEAIDKAETAFDLVLGYLAQLGNEVPVDLWKLVYARILDMQLVRMVDTIMSQADKFGIIVRTPDVVRFTKPGFAEMLRERFEELANAEQSHRDLAQLMESYYEAPNHEQVKIIANHWRLGGRTGHAVRRLFQSGEEAFHALDLDAAREYYLQIQKIFDAEGPIALEEDVELATASKPQLWLRLGEIHGALGEHGAAEDALRRAIQDADPNDRHIHGKAQKLLGDLAASQERYNDALRYYEQAREIYRQLGQARPFVAITGEMGQCALMQSRSSLAEDLSRQALDMAARLKDRSLVARVHRQMGQVLTRRGRFVEAIEYLDKSMRLFEAQNRDFEVIGCLCELGNAAFASGRFTAAREHFVRATALTSSLHMGTHHEPHLGLARSLAALENLAQAEAHLAEALARSGTQGEVTKMAELHLYIGDLFLARREHRNAAEAYAQVVEVARSVGQTRLWIDAIIRQAYVALDAGDEKTVYERLGEALQQAQGIHDQEAELQIRAHIIYTQLLQHGFRTRGDTFSTLLSSSGDNHLTKAQILCCLFKADVSAAQGEYDAARELLRQAHTGAAQVGDYSLFIPIARRTYLIKKEMGQLGDPHIGAGYAIGATIPPEVGVRRFDDLPRPHRV